MSFTTYRVRDAFAPTSVQELWQSRDTRIPLVQLYNDNLSNVLGGPSPFVELDADAFRFAAEQLLRVEKIATVVAKRYGLSIGKAYAAILNPASVRNGLLAVELEFIKLYMKPADVIGYKADGSIKVTNGESPTWANRTKEQIPGPVEMAQIGAGALMGLGIDWS